MSKIARKPIRNQRRKITLKSNSNLKGGIVMKQVVMHATPVLTGEDAKSLMRDAMRKPTIKMKKKHEMMLEVLERVSK